MSDERPTPRDFASFYRATVAPLRRYLARMTGSQTDAQDIAHDAYARVFPSMQEKDVGRPQAFLYTTARHLALDRLKRRSRSPIRSAPAGGEDAAVSPSPAVESVVMAREEWALLEQAVATLPPGCRQVLLMRTLEQLSHEEIAERLGLARSSVEKHLMRAARLLQEAMRAQPQGHAGVVLPLRGKTGTTGQG